MVMRSLGARAQGERLARMRASRLWDGERFRNLTPIAPGLRDPGVAMPSLSDFLCGGERRQPEGELPTADPRERWRRPPTSGLRATWLSHSTVLLEMDGVRVLTDPVWGKRASPSSLLGPRRFFKVPVPLKAMPDVDVVLISHDHYDHLDYPTIRELAHRDWHFVTSLGVGAHLQAWGVRPERITELDWWEAFELPGNTLRVTATPSQHFSGRTPGARNATLWSSFVIESAKHRVFFSGDTGLSEDYAQIRARFAPFDLIMLEIGAYHPAWGDIHLGPDNALKALTLLGGGPLLPIHWATFNLAMHAWDAPAESLLSLAPAAGAHLLLPRPGAPIEPTIEQPLAPWWRALGSPAMRPPAQPETLPTNMPWPVD